MFLLDLERVPFALDCTLACGQVFRWHKKGDTWVGVVAGRVLQIERVGSCLQVWSTPEGFGEQFVRGYFRLDDDLCRILGEIGRDDLIRDAIQALPGLRLVRQEPWECLASYICASYNNIPRIRGMIQRLCERFGDEVTGDPTGNHSFPSALALSRAASSELIDCGLGYRAQYLRDSAKAVAEERVDLNCLRKASYEEARTELIRLPGVGNKVADCVCLFALEKLEAFPVDVWIQRILTANYAALRPVAATCPSTLTPRQYREINTFGRCYFGKHAGYAQQYLYARFSNALKNREPWSSRSSFCAGASKSGGL